MNFKELRGRFITDTALYDDPEEALSIFYLAVESISGWNRSKFILNQQATVDQATVNKYLGVLKLLGLGTPIQYILGEAWFYGLSFKVDPFVLIPRPETEELVEWILAELPSTGHPEVLDIGTGSGCIAIALKKNHENAMVSALDISAGALHIAEYNAINNKVVINFIEADILQYTNNLTYDVIVSNPPYIKEDERDEMHANVLSSEPHTALFVSNEDPLIFYKAIADFALKNLKPGGLLCFEINEYLGGETVEMLNKKGFSAVVLRKDMQGKDRMIFCRKGN